MLSFLLACYLGLCEVSRVVVSGCWGFVCSLAYGAFLCVLGICLRAPCF